MEIINRYRAALAIRKQGAWEPLAGIIVASPKAKRSGLGPSDELITKHKNMTTGLRYQFQYHRTTAPKRLSWSPDLAPSICGGAKSPIIHPERHHQGVSQTNFVLGNVVENWVHISFALGNVAETDIALMVSRGIVSSLPASAVCAFIFFV